MTSVSPAGAVPCYDSLSELFTGLRKSRVGAEHGPPNHESIASFFEALAHTRRGELQEHAPAQPSLSPERLSSFLATFADTYHRQQRSGVFVDPWSIAGLGRDEVRNSAVLAWLFDRNGSHGFGSCFLRQFLRCVPLSSGQSIPVPHEDATYMVFREKYSLADSKNRVDLLIENNDFILYLEAKIDAAEGEGQIASYQEVLRRRAEAFGQSQTALIYLTRERRKPRDGSGDAIVLATWRDVADAIDQVMVAENMRSGELTKLLLNTLAQHFRRL